MPGRPAPERASALDLDGEVALEVLAEQVGHTDDEAERAHPLRRTGMSPLTDRASPFGRLPAIRCQTYGPTWPPSSVSLAMYRSDLVASGNLNVVMSGGRAQNRPCPLESTAAQNHVERHERAEMEASGSIIP